jgi:hypothetical protein
MMTFFVLEEMGDALEVWRARIGQFLGPRNRHKSKHCSTKLRRSVCFALLAVICILHFGNSGLNCTYQQQLH